MPREYPYMVSNNKIPSILEKVKTAARPTKFTHEFLKHLGFVSSNDRAIIPLFKKLEFLHDDGTPTEYYDRLKDPTDHPYVLGERIKDLYSDLFSINININVAPDEEIKGAFSRITGKEEKTVLRYFSTFKTLCSLAKFGSYESHKMKEIEGADEKEQKETKKDSNYVIPKENQTKPDFYYNIQIHLPATTDISVYNAIFKSLKENLLL